VDSLALVVVGWDPSGLVVVGGIRVDWSSLGWIRPRWGGLIRRQWSSLVIVGVDSLVLVVGVGSLALIRQ